MRILLTRLSSVIATASETHKLLTVLMVTNLSREATDHSLLLDHFRKQFGESVLQGTIVLDLKEAQLAMEEKKVLMKRMEEIEQNIQLYSTSYKSRRISTVPSWAWWLFCCWGWNIFCYVFCCFGYGVSKKFFELFTIEEIVLLRQQVNELDENIAHLISKDVVRGTGVGYIVIGDHDVAQTILQSYSYFSHYQMRNQTSCSRSLGMNLNVQRAPNSDDIIFDHLGHTSAEKLVRRLGALLLLLFIISLVYSVSLVISCFWFLRDNIRHQVNKIFSAALRQDGFWLGK